MTRIFLLTTLILFNMMGLCAQSVYSGKVVSDKNEGVSYANVCMLNAADSSFIQGTVTDEDGSFSIHGIDESHSDMLLRVSCMGYDESYVQVKPASKSITVCLHPSFQNLSEAEVRYVHPNTRIEGDAIVTAVKGTILERLGMAKDVLGNVPGLMENGESIEVIGKGVPVFYINGRPMRSEQELERISSDCIKQVEVVTNPGARYDASVNAIVRITTEKPVGEGFSVEDIGKLGYRDYLYGSDVLNLSYRKKRLEVFANVQYDNSKSKKTSDYAQKTWTSPSQDQTINMYGNTRKYMWNSRVGLDLSLSNENSLGFFYDVTKNPSKGKGHYVAQLYDDSDALLENIHSTQKENADLVQHMLEGYYTGSLGQWALDGTFDYLWKKTDDSQSNVENADHDSFRNVASNNQATGHMYAWELNAGRGLWAGSMLRSGISGTSSSRKETFVNPDGTLGNSATKVNEWNTGIYAELAQNIGKCQLRFGLRYEHVQSNINKEEEPEHRYTYDKLLPNFLFVAPVGKGNFQVSYSRKYDRPMYSQLSDQIFYVNRYLYQSGNSQLRTVYRDEASLNYQYSWFMLMANYTRFDGRIITQSSSYQGNPNITLLRKENSARDMHQYSIMLSAMPRFKAYNPALLVGVIGQNYAIDYRDGVKHMNHPMLMMRFNNMYAFSNGFYARADFSYMGMGNSENVRMKSYWNFSASVSKSLGRNWLVQLSANDIFNTSGKREFTVYSDIRDIHMRKVETVRSVQLLVRYRLNRDKSRYKGTGTGADERERF